MAKRHTFLTVTLLGLVPMHTQAKAPDAAAPARGHNYDASMVTTAPRPVAAQARDSRGVPTMLIPPSAAAPSGLSAEAAAKYHLAQHRGAYRVSRAALTGTRTRFVHDLGRGGIVVSLRQTLAGVEVFHGDIKVLLGRGDHRLLGISGAPHPAAVPGNRRSFALTKSQAITRALTDLYPGAGSGVTLTATGERSGGWDRFALAGSSGPTFAEPARVKPVYFPIGDALVPAWSVEVQVRKDRGAELDAFHYIVAADDGRMLLRRDLTDYEAFNYRVWAEPDGDRRPLDGPTEDWTPHPTGEPVLEGPLAFTPAGLVAVEGLNHNPNDLPDPWLAPGATETRGNNVDAYVDWTPPDGLSAGEFRAPTTAAATFDHTYDTTAEPMASVKQSQAVIVQLFYDVNWLHDWWYDSGFVESAGIAQMLNYGRGGVEGDPIKAEAQDRAPAGARNDANMVTPADGARPRMQMYLWSPLDTEATLDVQPAGTVTSPRTARFGPKTFDTTAALVLVDDGVMTLTDACEAPVNDLAGKVALVDRGTCSFELQAKNVQAAGAIAVVIANNVGGDLAMELPGENNLLDPTIPVIGVTQNDGIALKVALKEAQTAHLSGTATHERDGALDNTIVAHEFGHYLHRRLQHCLTPMCDAMSEGWGDFSALLMALREGDDLDGTYADSTYANFDRFGYFGRRRVPYSADPTRNALTFKHVSDGEALPNLHPVADNGGKNSEAHNAGEVWASALWEGYTALQKADGADFAAVNRAMSDYVVAGLMLAPDDATFTEQRDALLMAARADSEADYLTLAEAFAVRGFGSCAVSPPRTSVDLKGVVEDYELHPNAIAGGQLTMSDDVLSCDDDGIVDVDEVGTIKIVVSNAGMLALPQGSTLEIVDPPPGLSFPDGPIAVLDGVEPFASVEASIQVAVDPNLPANDKVTVTARLTTPDGCQAPLDIPISVVVNADLALDLLTTDDFETTASVWEVGGDQPAAVWSISKSFADGSSWHGNDLGVKSDTFLISPVLSVSDSDPFTIAFEHRFKFEFGPDIFWDGAVVEISEDAGATWNDATTYGATPAYNGQINSALNVLHMKPVYGDKNPSYPAPDSELLDFGTALAGKDVLFRFRIGTDSGASDLGWDIDNVVVSGITNTPFPGYVPDTGMCAADTDTDTDSDTSATDSSTGDTDPGTSTSSSSSTDTDATDTIGDTTSSTGPGTTTLETSDTLMPTSDATDDGPIPTSSATEGAESETSASTGATDTDPGEVSDDGCGCDVDQPRGWGLQLAPWLALLGLRRRRRRA